MQDIRLFLSAAMLAALPLGLQAQDAGVAPGNAPPVTQDSPLTSPNVQESLMPPPTEQGTRPPGVLEEAEREVEGEEIAPPESDAAQAGVPDDQGGINPETVEGEEQQPRLYELLAAVRQAPPGLDGVPTPRPNVLGSQPLKDVLPVLPPDLYLFPENYIE